MTVKVKILVLMILLILIITGCSSGINGKWVGIKEVYKGREYDLTGRIAFVTISSDRSILFEHQKKGESEPYSSIKYYFELKPEYKQIYLYPLKSESKGTKDPDNIKRYYYTKHFELTSDGFLILGVWTKRIKFKKKGWF